MSLLCEEIMLQTDRKMREGTSPASYLNSVDSIDIPLPLKAGKLFELIGLMERIRRQAAPIVLEHCIQR